MEDEEDALRAKASVQLKCYKITSGLQPPTTMHRNSTVVVGFEKAKAAAAAAHAKNCTLTQTDGLGFLYFLVYFFRNLDNKALAALVNKLNALFGFFSAATKNSYLGLQLAAWPHLHLFYRQGLSLACS